MQPETLNPDPTPNPYNSTGPRRAQRRSQFEASPGQGDIVFSPSEVDRIWVTWESYYNIPIAIFYLLQEDYTLTRCGA